MPVKIFFCYAHEDEQLLNELKIHLDAFRRQGLIEMWYDRNISGGLKWADEIDKHLDTANIILLLVSQYFMASDYCYGIEMKKAIKRHERGEAIVIPIILRPVHFQGAPFGKLQALPTDAKPVTSKSWANQDEAFYDVAEGIRKVVKETLALPFSPSPMPPLPTKLVSLKKDGASDFILDIDQGTGKRNAQGNLFVQPPNIPNQQWNSLAPLVSASESVHIESLFDEAVIAQSNGNLEEALELYQQVRKRDQNYKKGQLTSQLKKLFQQQVSEASRRNDQKSQIKYLNELLKLDPNDTSVQKRLEKLSLTYIEQLRQRAISARQSSKWEIEYKSLEEILKLRPRDIEAQKYIKPANIKYLRQQARNARKAASWNDEARKWSELSDLLPANFEALPAKFEAKRRQAIAMKNQDHIWMYEDALQLESKGHLNEARETLERLWHDAPYYGDPKRLARKVGMLIPLPLEKWRRVILLTLLASLLVLLVISIILSFSHIDSTLAWVGLIADVITLYLLSKYWLLINW